MRVHDLMKTLTLNVTYLTFVSSTALPLIVGFITKLNAHSRVKAITLLVLSGVAGLVQTLVAKHGVVEWRTLFDNSISAYVIAFIAHAGVLKPTGASDAVASIAPAVGIGAPVADEVPPIPPQTASAWVYAQPTATYPNKNLLSPTVVATVDPELEDLGKRLGL